MPIDINKREFSAMLGEDIPPEKIKAANKELLNNDSKKEIKKLEKFLNTDQFIEMYNLQKISEEFYQLFDKETSEKIMNELMQQADSWHADGKSDKDIKEQLKYYAEKNLNFGK